MRKSARVAIVIILAGVSTMPMLQGRERVTGNPERAGSPAPNFVLQIGAWGRGIRLSEPALLVFLGLGLMVTAGRLPAVLRMSSRLQVLRSKRNHGQQERSARTDRMESSALLKFEPPPSQSTWPKENKASNGTLG